MRRHPLLLAVVAAALTAAAALAAAGTAATAPFNPTSLAGTWLGTWKNETFNTTGEASIVATAPGGTRLNFTIDFGGQVFGCADPPPDTDGIPKGAGPNAWDETGFRLVQESEAFGKMTLTYDHAAATLKGGGTNPTCLAGLRWELSGTFAGNSFTGSISIVLPDGTPASSALSLTRTPEPDTTAPTVITQGYVGARSAPVPLRWRARDLNGKATFAITVAPLAKAGAPQPKAVLTKTLRGQVVGIDKLSAHRLDWAATGTTGTWFRFCVTATDTARNASKPTCSKLRLG